MAWERIWDMISKSVSRNVLAYRRGPASALTRTGGMVTKFGTLSSNVCPGVIYFKRHFDYTNTKLPLSTIPAAVHIFIFCCSVGRCNHCLIFSWEDKQLFISKMDPHTVSPSAGLIGAWNKVDRQNYSFAYSGIQSIDMNKPHMGITNYQLQL